MSAIYTANTSASTVAASGIVPLGQMVHQMGCLCTLNGNSISLRGKGMYKVDIAIVATGTNLSFQLYQNGVPVTGAIAAETGQASTSFSMSIPALVLNKCCKCGSTLTVVNVGSSTTVDNIAVVVTKL